MSDSAPSARTFTYAALALIGLAALVRALGFELVLVDDRVVFPIADAQYHVRRALFSYYQFPAALLVDPYINFPGGAAVAWPPGWDWALAAVGQLTPNEGAFERMLAWAPVAVGATAVLPVCFAARKLAGPVAVYVAGLVLALLPVHATFSRVGNVDHHAAVSFLGAWLLFVVVGIVESRDRWVLRTAALLLLRTALMLTWHGSLLYVAVVDGGLVLAVVAMGCRRTAIAHLASAAGSALALAFYVSSVPTPLLGPFSSIALSWLHVIALVGVCVVEGSLVALLSARFESSRGRRLVVAVVAGSVFLGLLMLLPGPREGLEPALQFLTVSDAAGARTGEQFPLFGLFDRAVRRPAWISWGLVAYTIPFVPLALLFFLPRRPGVWILVWWTAIFGLLTIGQRRYGNDLAPSICVGLGLLAAHAVRVGRGRFGLSEGRATAAALGLAVLLLAPGILTVHLPKIARGIAVQRGQWAGHSRMNASVAGSLTRFALAVRRNTPETAGFFDPEVAPEYGIVSHANLGHALQNLARRPTPTDPFWSYIGEANWDHAFGLLNAQDEAKALAHAEALRARYLVTTPVRGKTIEARLHFLDGSATDDFPHLGHFRLIVEGPRGGRTSNELFERDLGRAGRQNLMPYKLFEIVRGARIVVSGSAGDEVRASTEVETVTGRSFRFSARGTIGPEGQVEIVVPYGKGGPRTTHTKRPYRVEVGGDRFVVRVSNAQVAAGSRLHCCERS